MDNNDFATSGEEYSEEEGAGGFNVREDLVTTLGLDDEFDNELLDKLVEREQGLRKGHSELQGNYKKVRDTYKTLKEDPRLTGQEIPKDFDPAKFSAEQEQKVAEKFNEEYLEETGYSDELKDEIREWSKFKSVSARSATKAPHIAVAIEKLQKEQRIQEASKNGSGQQGTSSNDSGGGKAPMPDKFTDPKFMATVKGQKEYDEWTKDNR